MRFLNEDFSIVHPEVILEHINDDKLLKSYNITKFHGSLTNTVYKATLFYDDDDDENNKNGIDYLLRIYGSQMDCLVDRASEADNIKRVPKSVGSVDILMTFNNGRVEKFIHGVKSFSQKQMVDERFSHIIAQKIRLLHDKAYIDPNDPLYHSKGFAWMKIDEWLDNLEHCTDPKWVHYYKNILLCKDFNTFKRVVSDYYKLLISFENVDQPNMVCCHNDLQQGNILLKVNSISDPIPNIMFIDYEYMGINFAQFDISNFLTECMHDYQVDSRHSFICDGSKYPSKNDILNFLRSYLMTNSTDDTSTNEVVEKELMKLYDSVIRWRGSTQLFWALWALLQSGVLYFGEDKVSEHKLGADIPDFNEQSPEDESFLLDTVESKDSFNYMAFAKDKLSYFWGDMIKLGLATDDDCMINQVKFLSDNAYISND